MTLPTTRSAGFTLIEMIMVIVIIGIIAGMVAVFIRAPVEGYVDSVRRAELTDAAEAALRRIQRDVRLALPNSLREVTGGFEFILTQSGGRYRDETDGSTGGNFLSFTDAADQSFDVLGPLPAMAAGDAIVVYNLGATGADAYAGSNRAAIAGIAGNTVTLTSNTFATQSPPLPSPGARFQVVGQNDQVVRYDCSGGVVTRHAGCDFSNTANGCTSAVLVGSATTTAACSVNYLSAETHRNGLLYIELRLTADGETVTLFNQIRVDNTP
jgi:MSHA biogenesis protein MshO